jgi:hypothetical protein
MDLVLALLALYAEHVRQSGGESPPPT